MRGRIKFINYTNKFKAFFIKKNETKFACSQNVKLPAILREKIVGGRADFLLNKLQPNKIYICLDR